MTDQIRPVSKRGACNVCIHLLALLVSRKSITIIARTGAEHSFIRLRRCDHGVAANRQLSGGAIEEGSHQYLSERASSWIRGAYSIRPSIRERKAAEGTKMLEVIQIQSAVRQTWASGHLHLYLFGRGAVRERQTRRLSGPQML